MPTKDGQPSLADAMAAVARAWACDWCGAHHEGVEPASWSLRFLSNVKQYHRLHLFEDRVCAACIATAEADLERRIAAYRAAGAPYGERFDDLDRWSAERAKPEGDADG